ncbi:hypothetical protein ELI13_36010 [Rhizobium ruizarguesonis]|uniref:Uncharacterized protein n=1 Tax=Rhizobium ruizarguesonis TaxID=2081791 RepID=A0ABY1WWB5_9HYPH|nr:hypothetical protein [Rhizobium ruizarguesonis]TAU13116.1 hypothetical protein ELI48_37800 [Rhizobium ruizarguesonis]TAU57020.1 hypothetical protein ELI45_38155 [Rhizobium ruizarguesonis]TAV18850.1 hypothetical protein ELI36_38330 [Rhizobium ruizarguesonis]TAV18888.1 hypothetical protein ELI36_38235 [Rhizobium ruizarguesonis]TAW01864.1 hypothetical protein ELI26_38920 [Rhizobium ruizarguesonis]
MEWWQLSGPAGYVSTVVDALIQHGVALAECPRPLSRGLVVAIAARAQRDHVVSSVQMSGMEIPISSSIVHHLARALGASGLSIGSVSDFLAHPDFSNTVFIVDGFQNDAMSQWSALIRALVYERRNARHENGPYLLLLTPPGLSNENLLRLAAGMPRHKQLGIVSASDTQAFAGALGLTGPSSLTGSVRLSTVIEIAAWSRDLIEAASQWSEAEQLAPATQIAALASRNAYPFPSWENGLVDLWGAAAVPHVAAAWAHGFEAEVPRRVWAAQVKAVLPSLDLIRRAIVSKYLRRLSGIASPQNPYLKRRGTHTKKITNPWDLEFYDLEILLAAVLAPDEINGLRALRATRNKLAHGISLAVDEIAALDSWWIKLTERFPPLVPGWQWPRTGQKLILTIGPPQAGKSTWAIGQDATVIASSDSTTSSLADLDRDARIRSALEKGTSVIIDDRHLFVDGRLDLVGLAPRDIDVEYVVLDRSIEDKVAGLETRAQAKVRKAHEQFQANLAHHLSGDGQINVIVRDLRSGS